MRTATRIIAPFALSSLAALLGFACTAQVEAPVEEAPAADEATPPKPPGEVGGEHGTAGEALEHCRSQCELHYDDCKNHVAHRYPRAMVQCDHVHEQCLDRCQHDADHAGDHSGEHEGEHGH